VGGGLGGGGGGDGGRFGGEPRDGVVGAPDRRQVRGERGGGQEFAEPGGVREGGGEVGVFGGQGAELADEGLAERGLGHLGALGDPDVRLHGEQGADGGVGVVIRDVAVGGQGEAGVVEGLAGAVEGHVDFGEQGVRVGDLDAGRAHEAHAHPQRLDAEVAGLGEAFADKEDGGEFVHGGGDLGVLAAVLLPEADQAVAEGDFRELDAVGGLAAAQACVDLAPESSDGLVDLRVGGEGAGFEADVEAVEACADDVGEFGALGVGGGHDLAEDLGDGAGADAFGAGEGFLAVLAASGGGDVPEAPEHGRHGHQGQAGGEGGPGEAFSVDVDGLLEEVPPAPAAGVDGVALEEAFEVSGEAGGGLVAEFFFLSEGAGDDGVEVVGDGGVAGGEGRGLGLADGAGHLEDGAFEAVGE
jgi:hypothetical protein